MCDSECVIRSRDAVAQLQQPLGGEERRQGRDARSGVRHAVNPSANPTEIGCCGGGNVSQAGLAQSSVARAQQSMGVGRLRGPAFHIGAQRIRGEESTRLSPLMRWGSTSYSVLCLSGQHENARSARGACGASPDLAGEAVSGKKPDLDGI